MNVIEIELKDYLFFDSEKSLLIKPGEKLTCYFRKKDVVIFHHSPVGGLFLVNYIKK